MLACICCAGGVLGNVVTSPAETAGGIEFVVYDSLLYTNLPDLRQEGMHSFTTLYEDSFWNDGESHSEPNLDKVAEVAKGVAANSIVAIDIECWKTRGVTSTVRQQNAERFIAVAKAFRAAVDPSVKFGFYGNLPVPEWDRCIMSHDSAKYQAWIAENEELAGVAAEVDYIFPSLYTVRSDPSVWAEAAAAIVEAARSYDKPVIPFLWPQYHQGVDDSSLAGLYLPADFWQLQLETCYAEADSVVLWGGWQQDWDSSMAWYSVTRDFIRKYSLSHRSLLLLFRPLKKKS